MLAGQEYAEAADIYSVAVILWELAARNDFLHEVPFWNAKEQHVMNGGRSEIPADTPPALREAITLCWANEPAQRASMSATAQLLARALPPDAACVLPAQTPQLPGSLPLPQDSGPPGSSVLDSSTSNSPHEGASSLSVTDDDRPPQSASRDLLAVTLVSPRLRCLEPDWMPPVVRDLVLCGMFYFPIPSSFLFLLSLVWLGGNLAHLLSHSCHRVVSQSAVLRA